MDNLQTSVISKQDFLVSDDNSSACIMLVEKACEQYQRIFNKTDVPYSYIEFFCKEFNKYSVLFEGKLKEFYNNFVKLKVTASDLIDRYNKSFYSQHASIKVTKDEKYLVFSGKILPTFSNEMREVTNTRMSGLTENILNICKKIDSSDELVDTVELYEMYMIDRFILSHDFGANVKAVKKAKKLASKENKTTKPEESQQKNNVTLVGGAIEDNYQLKGKSTKVVIPKLKLPSAYPISEKGRVDKQKRTNKFCSPAREIIFLNRKKIVAIKYSTSFLEKRKVVKPKKKFSFDF